MKKRHIVLLILIAQAGWYGGMFGAESIQGIPKQPPFKLTEPTQVESQSRPLFKYPDLSTSFLQPSAIPTEETTPFVLSETVQSEEKSISLQPFEWQQNTTEDTVSVYAEEIETQDGQIVNEMTSADATVSTLILTEKIQSAEVTATPAMVTENTAPVIMKCAHHDHEHHYQHQEHRHHHSHHHHHHHFFHSPRLKKGCNVFLTNEYLYWTTKEQGLAYGMYYLFNGTTPFEVLYGKTRHINPDMRLGYRNGIRYEFPDTHWDLNAVWTSYHNSKDSEFLPHNDLLFATFFLNKNFAPIANGAQAHWDLDFNAVDLEAAYTFRLGSSFSFRAFTGLKAAWIDQDVKVKYLNVTFTGFPEPVNVASRNSYNSHNYGLRTGLNTQYHLGKGFKLFVNSALAVIWSSFNIIHIERAAGHPVRAKRRDSFESINPEVEVATGIAWQTDFKHRRCFLDLRLGWEQQVWISQNQFNQMSSAFAYEQQISQSTNMSFSGPTFSATFGF
jgi:hypothetical protein